MEITDELFVIPERDQFILYAPLDNSIVHINPSVLNILKKLEQKMSFSREELEVLEELKRRGIVKSKNGQKRELIKRDLEYSPTSVTLLPTYNCNLRCIYCYSRGGEEIGDLMDLGVAKAAIDLVIENSKRLGRKRADLGFHGGGEPFLATNMTFLKKVVEYFKERCGQMALRPRVSGATNGVLNRKDLEWIIGHFDHLNVSLDGPEDIQNMQRPKQGGEPSYGEVMETIAYCEEKKFHYGIRTTITADSVSRIPEIVEFLSSVSSNRRFHIEPLFECGRCKTTKASAPDSKTFSMKFIEARKAAQEAGIEIYYSGSKLGKVTFTFCGAAGRNFFVTPDGYVTTCLEVSRITDKGSDVFFVGRYDSQSGQFKFNDSRLAYLYSRTVDNIPHCKNCFAKYNCAGDCLGKTLSGTGDIFDTSLNPRCLTNREILTEEMLIKLNSNLGGKKTDDNSTE